jgi:hypothetical protein
VKEAKACPDSSYTSDDRVCSSCHKLLVRPLETLASQRSATRIWRTILQSAENGCLLCNGVIRVFSWEEPPEDSSWEVRIRSEASNLLYGSGGRDGSVPSYIDCKPSGAAEVDRRDIFELNEAISYGLLGQMRSFASDPNHPRSVSVRTPIQAGNTGDRRCLHQASAWIRRCLKSHSRCNDSTGHSKGSVLPTRFLCVRDNRVRIIMTNGIRATDTPSYMTISHRWHQTNMPKLLSSNIKDLNRNIDILALPQMFQDAIFFARRLSIFYVWIDALCIVQDDEEDKGPEIAKMDHIYRNAILNVGAVTAAQNDSDPVATGLFVDRDPQKISPFALTIKRKDYEHVCHAYIDDRWSFSTSSLFKRGWILQERLLSRRTIFFGEQLRWECSETIATEAFPSRIPHLSGPPGLGLPGIDTPLRLGTLLTRRHGTATQKFTCDSHSYDGWQSIVEQFTRCRLSYEEDFLPALSGLASRFRTELGSQYHAGLWRNDLIRGLLWTRDIEVDDGCPPRPAKYRGRAQRSVSLV